MNHTPEVTTRLAHIAAWLSYLKHSTNKDKWESETLPLNLTWFGTVPLEFNGEQWDEFVTRYKETIVIPWVNEIKSPPPPLPIEDFQD